MLGVEAGDSLRGVICADDQSAVNTRHCVLGNHAHAGLNISLVEVADSAAGQGIGDLGGHRGGGRFDIDS